MANPRERDDSQFSEPANYTVKGKVVLAKNPCLYPGDIRVLEAIESDKLKHYVNVVVFPSKGPRPHPNETSGSDLDGDVYFLSWDPRLVPKQTDDPAYFPSMKANPSKSITHEEIINFFADYMRERNLGKIANAHLVKADQSSKKARDEACLYLAEQHSIEVDFPKTGVPGVLRKEDQVHSYPDFMEKENEINTYESETILGIIYRKAKKKHDSVSSDQLDSANAEVAVDTDLVVPGYENYYDLAKANYLMYIRDMETIMRQYEIQSEEELISGNVISLSKFHTVKTDKDDILERIKVHLKEIIRKHETMFIERLKPNDEEEKRRKASAYYIVAYDSNEEYKPHHGRRILHGSLLSYTIIKEIVLGIVEKALRFKAAEPPKQGKKKLRIKQQQRFLSFPWLIVGKCLCKLKKNDA